MGISIINAKFDDKSMWLTLSDGRLLGVSLAYFSAHQRASLHQLGSFALSHCGIHWDVLNEDLSLYYSLTQSVVCNFFEKGGWIRRVAA